MTSRTFIEQLNKLIDGDVERHPLHPFIRFLGKDNVEFDVVVTTIYFPLLNLYETAINLSPVERYSSCCDAIKGHVKWIT